MKKLIPMIALLLLAAPALATEAKLDHDHELQVELPASSPTPEASPTPTPAPTLEPRCEDVGPLVPCRARQDPAAVLNQRVTALEQRDGQIIAAFQELVKRVDALPQAKPVKK